MIACCPTEARASRSPEPLVRADGDDSAGLAAVAGFGFALAKEADAKVAGDEVEIRNGWTVDE